MPGGAVVLEGERASLPVEPAGEFRAHRVAVEMLEQRLRILDRSPLGDGGGELPPPAAEPVSALIAQRGGRLGKPAEHRLRFAVQMLAGTLVTALVNRPGPLQLVDPRLEGRL